ncbi:MAG TPA: hypothetical protein VFV59_01605 [Candidatus Limnocylindria bacterium]|nr:hypothetical protein [Candidatus Limnocylindria bacterium]
MAKNDKGGEGRADAAQRRKVTHGYDRGPKQKSQKRPRRTLEEKLRRYESHAEGYEFIPALMHSLQRVVEGPPKGTETAEDRRLAQALKEAGATELIARAVRAHNQIPMELKRQAFSPRLLTRPLDEPVGAEETAAIVQRAATMVNVSVAAITPSRLAPAAADPKHRGMCCCPDTTTPPRDPEPPKPPPNQYELTFQKLYCVDESDPEWWGSDEPYVVFGIITEEMAESGTAAQAVATPVYEDVDDGDTRPSSGDQALRLFGFTGPRAIASSVLISATCFEHDLGDVSATTDAVRAALTAVATKAAAAGGYVGWIVAGVAVVGIGVSYLVDLIGADDKIDGSQVMSLTQADADARTASVNPSVFPPLHFDGGDGDGIYDVYLKLRRV